MKPGNTIFPGIGGYIKPFSSLLCLFQMPIRDCETSFYRWLDRKLGVDLPYLTYERLFGSSDAHSVSHKHCHSDIPCFAVLLGFVH